MQEAVEAEMHRQGPLAVHVLYGSLPATLKQRGARIGMPLTPAWLCYHLLRRAEAGEGVAEVMGCFVLVEPAPPASAIVAPAIEDPVPPVLLGARFWKLFVAEVHDLRFEAGTLTVNKILDKLPPGWVEATRRYGKAGRERTIRSCKLREKLSVRIRGADRSRSSTTGASPRPAIEPGSKTLGDEEAS